MYIVNLGDSQAVLCRCKSDDLRLSIRLTSEHKPQNQGEKERIIKSGGKIERNVYKGQFVGPYRVWANQDGPGIDMSRSFGDLLGKKVGIISTPDIEIIPICEQDKFVVFGSDGLFDVMSCSEVVSFVIRCDDKKSTAKHLVKEARSRWQY